MLDPSAPDLRRDPYAYLAPFREQAAAQRDRLGNVWVLRHAEATALLKGGLLGKDLRRWGGYDLVRPYGRGSLVERYVEQWMLSREAPDHGRLRRLALQAFTARAVAAMRVHAEAIAAELLAALPDDGEVDVVAGFARPFPVRVIGRILGLPAADLPRLEAWSDDLALVVEPTLGPQRQQRADVAAAELVLYARARIAERRTDPGDDLLSALVAAEEAGDRLGEEELVAMLLLLFVAGHETTTSLIGNGLAALLAHPAQLARLRAERALLPGAVEELLRYDAPGTVSGRVAEADLDVDGMRVRRGELVMVSLAAANHDPRAFAAPERLDLTRTPNPHLTFGGGVHYCLGAALARLEGQIAFAGLLDRWPEIALAEAPARRPTTNLRGFAALRLRVRARGDARAPERERATA